MPKTAVKQLDTIYAFHLFSIGPSERITKIFERDC